MLKFDFITIFPSIFDSYLKESILGRAEKQGFVKFAVHNLRDHTTDKHKTVDGSPYGGGAGMVMKVEPIFKAVTIMKKNGKSKPHLSQTRVILLSAKGKQFTQAMAKKFSKLDRIIFICGRYEGVDERVAKYIADEEVSVGPYVLTGGELPALTIIDATTRLIPGVLGNKESLTEESFSELKKLTINNQQPTTREYPQYTRPEVFEPKKGVKWKVPSILLSGDHKKIAEWRKKQMNYKY